MATWSFTPQDVVVMALGDATRAIGTAPAYAITGTVTSAYPFVWELHYPTVSSADVRAMHTFYRQQLGGRVPFDLVDPLMGSGAQTFSVRFASPLRIEWTGRGVYAVGPIRLVSTGLSTEEQSTGVGWGGEGEVGWGGEGEVGWGGR